MTFPGPQHRKRCKRYDVPGHAHYLTFSCFHRQSFLCGQRSPGWFLDALESARKKEPFDLWAFVIMPEHVHLLLLPHDHVGISAILSAVKHPVAKRALVWVKRNRTSLLGRMADVQPSGKVSYRFWQRGGGHDRNLWSATEIHEKIRYIHANPVRRRLVTHPEDWAWSSCRAWEEGINEPIRIDRDSLPPLEI